MFGFEISALVNLAYLLNPCAEIVVIDVESRWIDEPLLVEYKPTE